MSIVGLQLCSIRVLLRMPVPTFLSPRLLLMLLAPLQMEDLIAEDIMYLSHKMQKYEAGTDLETPCLLIDFQGARKFRAGERSSQALPAVVMTGLAHHAQWLDSNQPLFWLNFSPPAQDKTPYLAILLSQEPAAPQIIDHRGEHAAILLNGHRIKPNPNDLPASHRSGTSKSSSEKLLFAIYGDYYKDPHLSSALSPKARGHCGREQKGWESHSVLQTPHTHVSCTYAVTVIRHMHKPDHVRRGERRWTRYPILSNW